MAVDDTEDQVCHADEICATENEALDIKFDDVLKLFWQIRIWRVLP